MGSVSASCPALPDIGDLSSLFPEDCRGSEYRIVHVYASVTLLAFGAEKRIPELWQQIAQLYAKNEAAQATAAARLREGLVKASPLIGFPRVSHVPGQNLLVLTFPASHQLTMTTGHQRPRSPPNLHPADLLSQRPVISAITSSSRMSRAPLLPGQTHATRTNPVRPDVRAARAAGAAEPGRYFWRRARRVRRAVHLRRAVGGGARAQREGERGASVYYVFSGRGGTAG